jgi:hypothetical protein
MPHTSISTHLNSPPESEAELSGCVFENVGDDAV